MHAAGGNLSADPKTKVIAKLLEDLSMHQPYNPHAPLPPAATTQQSSVSTQVDPDLDPVIARYACRTHVGKGHVSLPIDFACLPAMRQQ